MGCWREYTSAPSLRLLTNELPELPVSDNRHGVPLLGKAADLDQLRPADRPGNLQHIGTASDQHVGRPARLRLHNRPCALGGLDRVAARAAQEAREGDPFIGEAAHAAEPRLLARHAERLDQLARGLVALAPHAE